MKQTLVLITLFSISLLGCKSSKYPELGDGIFADIQTTQGDIIVKLEHEKTPITVANFISLAEGNSPFVADSVKGKKYYDGIIFHRVMKDFMIQGGDPTGTGRGNPGYKFKDEFNDSLRHSKKGILSMANSGFRTNGSQFFITHKATPWLDGLDENGNPKPCEDPRVGCHTVFGEVVMGIEVVDSIANVEVVAPSNKPKVDVVMNKVEIIRNGKAARKFDAVQIMTDYFAEEEAKEAAMKKLKDDTVAEFEKQKAEAEETASGLRIFSLKKGEGEKPITGKQVMVNYAGWLSDGTLFDSNVEAVAVKFNKFNPARKDQGGYQPIPMDYTPKARLVPGFREGLLTMSVGDKVRLFIPSHLGYGPQGAGPIPPNSDLIFDLELIEVRTLK